MAQTRPSGEAAERLAQEKRAGGILRSACKPTELVRREIDESRPWSRLAGSSAMIYARSSEIGKGLVTAALLSLTFEPNPGEGQ
jgi:hypothetical protein